MRFLTDDDGQLGGTLQPHGLDVPTGAAQHLVPCGRERGDVGSVGTRHESHARFRRESEQIEDPSRRAGFQGCDGGRHHVKGCVLVPGRDEPVGGDRLRVAAAGDEPEVARPRGCHQPWLEPRSERVERFDRIGRSVRHRPVEIAEQSLKVAAG